LEGSVHNITESLEIHTSMFFLQCLVRKEADAAVDTRAQDGWGVTAHDHTPALLPDDVAEH